MIFRETTQADVEYMAENSINKRDERKMMACVDYIFTLEDEGTPLLVGGFRLITPTTAWCWFDMSHEAGKHLIVVYRTIKEWLNTFADSHGIIRYQAFVRTDSPEAIRTVGHLGFTLEGHMEKFFGDEDAFLYKRLI